MYWRPAHALQADSVIGSFAKVACSYNGSMADHELTVTKSDMVQVLDVGSQNMYYVRKDCVDTGSHQLGWLPAYVIGLRNQEEAPLKYVIVTRPVCASVLRIFRRNNKNFIHMYMDLCKYLLLLAENCLICAYINRASPAATRIKKRLRNIPASVKRRSTRVLAAKERYALHVTSLCWLADCYGSCKLTDYIEDIILRVQVHWKMLFLCMHFYVF